MFKYNHSFKKLARAVAALVSLIAFSLPAAEQTWQQVNGPRVTYLSIDKTGKGWGLTGFELYRFDGAQWAPAPGQNLSQVSAADLFTFGVYYPGKADPKNPGGDVYYKVGTAAWEKMPGLLKQVAGALNGGVFGVSPDGMPWTYDTPRRTWTSIGNAVKKVVPIDANTCHAIGVDNFVWTWTRASGYWTRWSITAQDLSVAADGTMMYVDLSGQLYLWDATKQIWSPRKAPRIRQIVVASKSNWWYVRDDNTLFHSVGDPGPTTTSFLIPVSGPLYSGTITLDVDTSAVNTAATDFVVAGEKVSTSFVPGVGVFTVNPNPVFLSTPPPDSGISAISGSLVCSDGGRNGKCGTDKADKVGNYAVNMNCAAGFYDPLWGGTCWKCPDDDGSGGWIRSTTNIQGSDACWRAPRESLAWAVSVKSTPWAWECTDGSFWDTGGCFKCPETHPRRTGNSVRSGEACATPANQTLAASLLSFNGCPAANATTMGLPGKRQPGRPFLDIAAGWTQGQPGGMCYSCPISDSDGNFLITERNLTAVTAADSCVVRFKWRPAGFTEPGLFGLGAAALTANRSVLTAASFTAELYTQAGTLKIPAANTKDWVRQQWQQVAVRPYQNNAFRTAIYARLVEAALTAPASRTAAQVATVAAMENYIRNKKTHIAREALAMYDAWKLSDTEYKQSISRSQLIQVFDYGTLPLDFNGFAATILTPAAAATTTGGLTASLVAVSAFKATNPASEAGVGVNSIYQLMHDGQIFAQAARGVGTAVSALAGATAISVAGAVLASVAIDQFIAIVSARPKLETALANAQKTVDLRVMLSASDGQDLLKYFFAKAVEEYPYTNEDPAVVQLAVQGNAIAAQTDYNK